MISWPLEIVQPLFARKFYYVIFFFLLSFFQALASHLDQRIHMSEEREKEKEE